MARRLPLNAFNETTLDASGSGAIELKPTSHGETWLVTSASIKVSSNTVEPEFNLYSNGVFIDGTFDGSLNATGLYEILATNQPMRGEWSGGDSGAIAQLRLGGWRFLET